MAAHRQRQLRASSADPELVLEPQTKTVIAALSHQIAGPRNSLTLEEFRASLTECRLCRPREDVAQLARSNPRGP